MRRLFYIYKTNIILTMVIVSLFGWALSASYIGATKKDKILLVRITNDGASLIDKLNPEDEMIEQKAFLRRFVALMYNYDYNSFQSNINKVSFILSDDLWLKTQKETETTSALVSEKKLTQTAAIEKIVRISQNTYEITLQSTLLKDGIPQEHKNKVTLTIATVQRTAQNPWGMEVTNATEERIM